MELDRTARSKSISFSFRNGNTLVNFNEPNSIGWDMFLDHNNHIFDCHNYLLGSIKETEKNSMSACYWWHVNKPHCPYCGWTIGNKYPHG